MVILPRDMTLEEALVIIDHTCELITDAYNKPIRRGFEKSSRSGQAGYDITRYFLDEKLIKVGAEFEQSKMRV